MQYRWDQSKGMKRWTLFTQKKMFFCVCIAWFKHQRGWENLRQLCNPRWSGSVCITITNSPNALSVYIRLCKHRKKVFYCFYKITFPGKNAKLFVWHWLKEKFLPVAKSCPRSLARVISSCFAKRCFPKYGFFSLKMSALAKKKFTQLVYKDFPSFSRRRNGKIN